jgi:hypothetical protein
MDAQDVTNTLRSLAELGWNGGEAVLWSALEGAVLREASSMTAEELATTMWALAELEWNGADWALWSVLERAVARHAPCMYTRDVAKTVAALAKLDWNFGAVQLILAGELSNYTPAKCGPKLDWIKSDLAQTLRICTCEASQRCTEPATHLASISLSVDAPTFRTTGVAVLAIMPAAAAADVVANYNVNHALAHLASEQVREEHDVSIRVCTRRVCFGAVSVDSIFDCSVQVMGARLVVPSKVRSALEGAVLRETSSMNAEELATTVWALAELEWNWREGADDNKDAKGAQGKHGGQLRSALERALVRVAPSMNSQNKATTRDALAKLEWTAGDGALRSALDEAVLRESDGRTMPPAAPELARVGSSTAHERDAPAGVGRRSSFSVLPSRAQSELDVAAVREAPSMDALEEPITLWHRSSRWEQVRSDGNTMIDEYALQPRKLSAAAWRTLIAHFSRMANRERPIH